MNSQFVCEKINTCVFTYVPGARNGRRARGSGVSRGYYPICHDRSPQSDMLFVPVASDGSVGVLGPGECPLGAMHARRDAMYVLFGHAPVASWQVGYMHGQEAVSETCWRDVRARVRHICGCIAFELGVVLRCIVCGDSVRFYVPFRARVWARLLKLTAYAVIYAHVLDAHSVDSYAHLHTASSCCLATSQAG